MAPNSKMLQRAWGDCCTHDPSPAAGRPETAHASSTLGSLFWRDHICAGAPSTIPIKTINQWSLHKKYLSIHSSDHGCKMNRGSNEMVQGCSSRFKERFGLLGKKNWKINRTEVLTEKKLARCLLTKNIYSKLRKKKSQGAVTYKLWLIICKGENSLEVRFVNGML